MTYARRPWATSSRTRCQQLATSIVALGPVRRDWQSPHGHLVEHRSVEVAKDHHRGRARNRRGGHDQQVRVSGLVASFAAFVAQCCALLDTKAVLFVDDDHAERLEAHVVGQQRVRAHDDVDGAVTQSRPTPTRGPSRARVP
jgi:hypothetical protein